MSLQAQSGADSFSPLIEDLIGGTPLEVAPGASDVWIHVEPRDVEMPPAGWKLHVSAIPSDAGAILRRVVPVLASERVAFKVAAREVNLYELNQGIAGRSQVGKFITVYPRDEEQAIRLAIALHETTEGLRGPRVPSDHALSPTSLVHYRYGGFVLEDERDRSPEPPPVDPFVEKGVVAPSEQRLIAGRYLITSTLHRSVRGAIHLAVDTSDARTCILKRAWRDACAMPDGRDARDRLREEAALITSLGSDPHFPEIRAEVEHESDLFVVMDYIKGTTWARWAHDREPAIEIDAIVDAGRELMSAIEKIHEHGHVHRDLSPANVILKDDGGIGLVDFELAQPIGEWMESHGAGTPGYMSPQQLSGEPAATTDDVFGIGALLFLAATGRDHDPEERTGGLPIALAQLIERSLETEPSKRWPSVATMRDALDR